MNQIVSKEKGKLSERVELFYTLSIEVKSKRSVLDGLAQFVEGEVHTPPNPALATPSTPDQPPRAAPSAATSPISCAPLPAFQISWGSCGLTYWGGVGGQGGSTGEREVRKERGGQVEWVGRLHVAYETSLYSR